MRNTSSRSVSRNRYLCLPHCPLWEHKATEHLPGRLPAGADRSRRCLIAMCKESGLWHRSWPTKNSLCVCSRRQRLIPSSGYKKWSLPHLCAGSLGHGRRRLLSAGLPQLPHTTPPHTVLAHISQGHHAGTGYSGAGCCGLAPHMVQLALVATPGGHCGTALDLPSQVLYGGAGEHS